MAHLLGIVKQQQAPIDEEKLRLLSLNHNIWDHFGFSREEFSALPEARQLQLLRKFYFDLVPSLAMSRVNSSSSHIDSSISNTIKSSSSLTMTKIIENGGKSRSLHSRPTKTMMEVKSATTSGLNMAISGLNLVIFPLKRPICPKTPYFILIKATSHARMEKGLLHRRVYYWANNPSCSTTQGY